MIARCLGLALALALCCGSAQAAPAPRLIVLFSCDTMRADRLGVYGYAQDTTPNLNAFAKDAVVFEQAFTPEPWTPSAHMSMLTGLYPKNHGLTANINAPESLDTLQECLKRAGYVTAGHTGMQWWFLPWRGFGQGFDEYSAPEGDRSVFETVRLGLDFLKRHPEQKAFLFLHTYDLHSHGSGVLPYGARDEKYARFSRALGAPPAFTREGMTLKSPTAFLGAHNQGKLAITPEESAYMQALYNDALLQVDDALGMFFASLREMGLYDDALIIITSDHGEAFGEQGRFMHGDIYEANVRVPLIVHFPGRAHAGARVKEMARLIDIFPTVMQAAGVGPPQVDGADLSPTLAAKLSIAQEIYLKRGPWRGLRTRTEKLIEDRASGLQQFFDLTADPAEKHNGFSLTAAPVSDLFTRERAFFAPSPGGWHIALRAAGAEWRARFRVSCAGRLASVALEEGFFEERNDEVSEARELEGNLVLKPGATDVLHVVPLDPAAPVRLVLSGPSRFSVNFGETVTASVERAEIELLPAAPGAATRPAWPDNPNENGAVIWYVPMEARGSAAPALSDDAKEALKSLGYVGP
jgi:arylsulfatase A-like enzyme